jgi:FkbM family methyltransferase
VNAFQYAYAVALIAAVCAVALWLFYHSDPIHLAKVVSYLPRGQLPALRMLTRLMPSLRNVPVKTRYGTIICDLSESVCFSLLRYGEYLHWRADEEALSELPIDGKIVLDIGANIGVTAVIFAARAKQVHAFEPSPRALRLLRLNAGPNVTVHPVALSDKAGTVEFEETGMLDMSHFGKGISVPCLTLDELGIVPDVIKIDVEGAEHLVLKGATKTLAHSPVIFFEALTPEAYAESVAIILAANPNYTFETISDNHVAWPKPRSVRARSARL